LTVLRNLLANAIKYSNPDSTIEIGAQKDQDRTKIWVKDHGIGMSAKRLSKLFDPSQFESTYGTQNEKGTGLGIKLCMSLVHECHGDIWAESEEGVGSTFFVELPLSPATHEKSDLSAEDFQSY